MSQNTTPTTSLEPHKSALLWAVAAALCLWFIPVVRWALLPIQYLNTHTHEFCHALVSVATGGSVGQIDVLAMGNGVTTSIGGSPILISSAGYVGASLIGAAMIYFGRTPDRARLVLHALAGLLAFSLIFWVRGDGVGILSGVLWMAGLWIAGSKLQGKAPLFFVQFLGVEQCLSSLQALLILLNLTARTEVQSDAVLAQNATGVPAMAWAVGWSLFSLAMVLLALRSAWRSRP